MWPLWLPTPPPLAAVRVSQVFPLLTLSRKQRTVLVVCGPEHNGAVGLVCARHLRMFVSFGVSPWCPWGAGQDRAGRARGGWQSLAQLPDPPQEYEPTIFYPTRSLESLHQALTTQCEKMDIPFLSYLPNEVLAGLGGGVGSGAGLGPSLHLPISTLTPQVQLINDAYRLVVDAILGPGVEPREVGGPCMRALATLKLLSIPLVSLDIPSGRSGGG